MKTTYFWKALYEPCQNTTYVSVSRGKMRGAEKRLEYPALMPSWDIINIAHKQGYNEQSFHQYRDAYFKQLDELDPQKVYDDLKNCTIVCFESAKDLASGDKFCHRQMIAGWLEQELGVKVTEELRDKESQLKVPAIFRG